MSVRHERWKLVLHAKELVYRIIVPLELFALDLSLKEPVENMGGKALRWRRPALFQKGISACASTWIHDNASFAAGQFPWWFHQAPFNEKANTGLEDRNRIAKYNCAITANLGHKEKPAFRIDVLKHAAKGG